jgi:hypothetical protein
MSDEFRGVHAATELLAQYKEAGDLELVKAYPINRIKRFDVWKCVFEEEPEAYRELEIKEMYALFRKDCYHSEDSKTSEICRRMSMTLVITFIDRKIEYPQYAYLSIEDLLRIVIHVCGIEILNDLTEEAKRNVEMREEIVSSYLKKDKQWVKYARDMQKEIKHFKSVMKKSINKVSK